jgi:hypothetical protein
MDVVMNTESTPHQELRAKIVAALNLTPLVPPQADTETLNVVEDAWAALSELMRSVEQYEEMKAAVDVWKTDALNWERHARDDHAKAKQLEEQLEAAQRECDGVRHQGLDAVEAYQIRWHEAAAEAEQLRKALRDIWTYTSPKNTADPFGRFAIERMQEIARAALDASSSPASVPSYAVVEGGVARWVDENGVTREQNTEREP